ncbi:uncharacterized protein PV06_11158 [Exophiala oligosperma]|uniref:Uncharacterized protein n=1 Tax=Exophiala oligosperma TaxID=215243 RepID=A0A0D2A8J5_9EURO|nr:uncharacterized protein PV06_11158 [Exophiala oligosperma]KIW36646.1 hypothetical protein PV06_11158 [Exophiala oligosperma]
MWKIYTTIREGTVLGTQGPKLGLLAQTVDATSLNLRLPCKMERASCLAFTLVTISPDSDLHAVHVASSISIRLSFISDVASLVCPSLASSFVFTFTSPDPTDSSSLDYLSHPGAPFSFFVMGKKQTPSETLRKAKEKCSARDTGIADGKPTFRKLEPGTERNYQRQLDLWHEFVRENPDASPYDLRSLQAFVKEMAYAIDGAEGIEEGCTETVHHGNLPPKLTCFTLPGNFGWWTGSNINRLPREWTIGYYFWLISSPPPELASTLNPAADRGAAAASTTVISLLVCLSTNMGIPNLQFNSLVMPKKNRKDAREKVVRAPSTALFPEDGY